MVAAEDGRAAHRALTRRLRAGGVVCLLADRDLAGSGVEVELFGEPARFPAGPARLAALTGALLIPAFPGFTPDGWSVRMAAPVPVAGRRDVPAATQAVADAFAGLIAAPPAGLARAAADLDRRPRPAGARGPVTGGGRCGSAWCARTRWTCPAGCRRTWSGWPRALSALGHRVERARPGRARAPRCRSS